jgi:hypothetical protein
MNNLSDQIDYMNVEALYRLSSTKMQPFVCV